VTPTAKNRIIDMMQFRAGGAKVPHDEFLQTHNDLLRDEWIIDGLDTASPLSAPTVNQLTVGAGIQTFCDGHHNLIERFDAACKRSPGE
jgi:hypothetical protein